MLHHFSKYLIIILTIIGLNACKKKNIPTSFVEKELNMVPLAFKYLSIKTKLNYQDGNNDLDAKMNIKIKKDSLIWCSITAILGIEVMRAQINQDSIWIVDKINRQYQIYNFEGLSKKIGIQVNYNILQALLLGEVPFPNTPGKISKQDNHWLIEQLSNLLTITNTISRKTIKLEKLLVIETPTNNSLEANYSNFEAYEEKMVAQMNVFSLKSLQKNIQTQITLEHQKVEFVEEAPSFSFKIPNDYQRIN